MNTDRHPRTMEQAFGPHTERHTLYPMGSDKRGHQRARYLAADGVLYAIAVCVVLALLLGVL